MKQRLKLAQALAHDPELLLLDEPTNGLDPRGRREMLALIHDLGHAQGKHVLLCSHLLPDVERTCGHVVVLDRGRVAESGRIADMTVSDGAWVDVDVGGDADAFAAALADAGVDHERGAPLRFRVRLPAGGSDVAEGGAADADPLFELARASGAWIAGVRGERSTLEDVFLRTLETGGDRP
jgi:ABC-2 type transport system ATP-binding protein